MKRRWRVPAVTVIALVALMSLSVHASRPSLAQTPGIYVALGDSVAAGIGSSLPRERGNAAIVAGWLARLTGETVPFENLGVPGETAATFIEGGQLQRFQDLVTRSEASGIQIAAVTLSLGGNEMLSLDATGLSDRQAGLDAFRDQYANAVASVRAEIGPDTPLVVSTYYDLTEGDPEIEFSDSWWIEQFNTVIRDVAEEHDARVADLTAPFANRIDELTHFPFDVHPSNEGHAAIARTIWETLALDTEPPSITVTSPLEATRSTPTVSFTVEDNVGVSTVTTVSDDVSVMGPFEVADGQYAILLDIGTTDLDEVALTIEISDDAGNTTSEAVTVQAADGSRGESQ
jgi:lysophospholipase L1-like esterase